MKQALALLSVFLLALAGCGGKGKDNFRGEVSGIVFDENGLPVRNALVYFDGASGEDRDTRTNSNGVYVLQDLPTGHRVIRVEVESNSVRYFGANVANILRGQRTMNHNIAVYPDDRLAAIEGFVTDRQGFRLAGARVFVKQQAQNTVLSSAYSITDDEGRYLVRALRANMPYDVQVNGPGYNSDFDVVTLSPGETRRMDFTIPVAGDIVLGVPQNLVATAWTSPRTRDRALTGAIENMKRILRPDRKPMASTRDTAGGNFIEIDLTWDPIAHSSLLGYGIYRSDAGSTMRDIYFLRDPLAELFSDMDPNLRELREYTYEITTISTTEWESDPSARSTARPLGDLVLQSPTVGPRPVFRWDAAAGADQYTVYLFNRYPSIGVQQIWDNEDRPTTSTQFQYDGGSNLGPGTYYYIVVGASNGGDLTLSPVGTFTL